MLMHNIEELENIFRKHHEKYMKEHLEDVDNFKRYFPEEPLPDDLKDDFSIALALGEMCAAIVELEKLQSKMPVFDYAKPSTLLQGQSLSDQAACKCIPL